MATITVWLLISLASGGSASGRPVPTVVEKFASVEECSRIAKWLNDNRTGSYPVVVSCIQATIVK